VSAFPASNEDGKSGVATTDVLARAADYAKAEKADATRLAYGSDFRHFEAWCGGVNRQALPGSPETCAAYFATLADSGLKASTIARRAAAICYAHRLAGHASPTAAEPVKAVLRGIRRNTGVAPVQKAPATVRTIRAMLAHMDKSFRGRPSAEPGIQAPQVGPWIPGSRKGAPRNDHLPLAVLRDRALLLIGFAAALRRSELVALDVGDIEMVPEGAIVHVRRSKTDQEGSGHAIPVPRGSKLRPIEALEEWLAALSGFIFRSQSLGAESEAAVSGPLFVAIGKGDRPTSRRLSDRAVADIVKRWAQAARLDPAAFSGHSLRAGFVTSALEAGADPFKVMDVTRHRRVETLKVYDRRAKAFRNHAGKDIL
jgi:site-specific recombinase XerD